MLFLVDYIVFSWEIVSTCQEEEDGYTLPGENFLKRKLIRKRFLRKLIPRNTCKRLICESYILGKTTFFLPFYMLLYVVEITKVFSPHS